MAASYKLYIYINIFFSQCFHFVTITSLLYVYADDRQLYVSFGPTTPDGLENAL